MEEIAIAILHVVTMTGVTTLVMVITYPGARDTAITLGHAAALATVTVDVVHAAVDTPPPIAMIGPTPVPDLGRLLQPRVIAAETGAGMTVGHLANLTPIRIPEVGVGSCLTPITGRDDIMLWHALPFADYLV